MERRLGELRQRLQRKKAALQQQDEQPVSVPAPPQPPPASTHHTCPQVGSVGGALHGAPSRVAAVGPYIQSSDQDGSGPGLSEDGPLKPPPRPLTAASGES